MKTIFIATGNRHKVAEFTTIFEILGVDAARLGGSFIPFSITGVPGMPGVEETADSYAGNAELKARAAQRLLPGDVWVLADDSGLEVEALGGAPGLFSARYAGVGATDRENLAKLLAAMVGVPTEARRAAFTCTLVLCRGPEKWVFTGRCEGSIRSAPSGQHGFGYDPIFQPDGYPETMAELGESVKNTLSHRARAVGELWRRGPLFR